MQYKGVLWDVDGTLVDSERAVVESLADALAEMGYPEPSPELCELAMRGTSMDVLRAIGHPDPQAGLACWNRHWLSDAHRSARFPGAAEAVESLHALGVRQGLVTSRTVLECEGDAALAPVMPHIDARVCVEDTRRHKPDPEPILLCLKRLNLRPEEALYVGDSPTDAKAAHAAGVDFALAQWGVRPGETVRAEHYPIHPEDLTGIVRGGDTRWLRWARELQFIAQAGLAYSRDPFDIERFQRVREISAEILAAGADMEPARVRELFCSGSGYQTPKLDTRAAIFDGDRILLVRERDGRWALPGGWVDVGLSIAENAVKEVREEAGLEVEAVKLIALQEHNRHNRPARAEGICTAIVLCRRLGGEFQPNIETTGSAYFAIDELPELAEDKTTAAQIRLCFAARSDGWQPPVD